MIRSTPLRTTVTCSFVLLAWLAAPGAGKAQQAGQPIVIGETLTLHSQVLDEDRTLLVHRPPGYDHSDARYPFCSAKRPSTSPGGSP